MVFAVMMTILAGSGAGGQIEADDRVGKPFVMVPIAEPSGSQMVSGRFHGISWNDTDSDGRSDITIAVGSYERTVSSTPVTFPMVLDVAAANDSSLDLVRITELAMPTGAISGEALAVSDQGMDEGEHPIIVGYVSNGTKDAAVFWEWTGSAWGTAQFIFEDGFNDHESRTLGVGGYGNDFPRELYIAGWFEDGSGPEPDAFRAILDAGVITSVTSPSHSSEAMAAYAVSNGSANIAGSAVILDNSVEVERARIWKRTDSTLTSIHPPGSSNLESAALDFADTNITVGTPIVGWTLKDETPVDRKYPTFWVDQSTIITFTFLPGFISSSEAFAVNSHHEVLVRGDSGGYALWKWVVNGQSQWIGDAFNFGAGKVVLPPSALDSTIASLTNINNDGWITGSYIPNGGSEEFPCLLVPYDLNNNGEPDFREIMEGALLGSEVDSNENWMIDQAEAMRVGLHNMGHPISSKTGLIEHTQAVRRIAHLKPRSGQAPTGLDDAWFIDEIVTPSGTPQCDDCEALTNLVNDWGTEIEGDMVQREVAIYIRSTFGGAGEGKHDYLPETEAIRANAVTDLRTFAYRFARCIDWIQFGNESFANSEFGSFKFRNDEIPGCGWETGGPKSFEDIGTDLGQSCQEAALVVMLDWISDEAEACLIGSALAGRPLRLVTPAITGSTIASGFQYDEINRHLLSVLTPWADEREMYIDVHLHYQSVEEVLTNIDLLVTGGPAQSYWISPERLVSLEWGPIADFNDDGWWTELALGQTITNKQVYNRFYTPNLGDPGVEYAAFIGRWEDDSDSFGDNVEGFNLGGVLDELASAGFNVACYGPTLNHDPGLELYEVAALRADQIVNDEYIDDLNQLTPLSSDLSAAIWDNGHFIDDFEPHPDPCSPAHTCPDCE